MYLIEPSVLAADFSDLGRQVQAVERAGAKRLHLDVMDGAFVPSISFGMPVIASIRKVSKLMLDVHMMVEEPGRYIRDIKKAGADMICVHQEACTHLDRVIGQIKEEGLKAGVAVNPATPVSVLDCVLGQTDMVLVMTVNPGFGGQQVIPYTLEKVRLLRKRIEERHLPVDIQIDGGVTAENVQKFLKAGADILVAGSAVFKGDAEKNMRDLMKVVAAYA